MTARQWLVGSWSISPHPGHPVVQIMPVPPAQDPANLHKDCYLVDEAGDRLAYSTWQLGEVRFRVQQDGQGAFVVNDSDEVLYDLGGKLLRLTQGDVLTVTFGPAAP